MFMAGEITAMLASWRRRWFAAAVGLLGFGGCASTGPSQPASWGSPEASLTVEPGRATVRILASGGCYGSYGVVGQPLPAGNFSLAGTYTQLIGAYPGHLDFPAQFEGTVDGRRMTLTIEAGDPPAVHTVGPFELTYGVRQSWPACQYP